MKKETTTLTDICVRIQILASSYVPNFRQYAENQMWMTKVCGSDTQSSNSETKVGGIVGIKIDQIMEPCEYMYNCDSWQRRKGEQKTKRQRKKSGRERLKYYVDKFLVNLGCIP